jgi:hypothetical protein
MGRAHRVIKCDRPAIEEPGQHKWIDATAGEASPIPVHGKSTI